MFTWKRLSAVVLAACVLTVVGRGDEPKPKDKGKTDPPGVPVEATLTAKKATYTLELGGQSGDEFRKTITAADKTGSYPEAPAVDLVLTLTNTGDKDVQIRVGGTTNVIDLDLQGPGAVSVPLKGQITPKFVIAPKTITLASGKSVDVPINSFSYGYKGANRAYWVEAGKYTLAASYKTTVSPAPATAKAGDDGFVPVTITSAPLTLTVESK